MTKARSPFGPGQRAHPGVATIADPGGQVTTPKPASQPKAYPPPPAPRAPGWPNPSRSGGSQPPVINAGATKAPRLPATEYPGTYPAPPTPGRKR